MAELELDVQTYLHVDYRALELFIIEILGVREDFSVAVALDAGNDTQHKIKVERLERNGAEYNETRDWRKDPHGIAAPSLPLIMGYLATNGAIPEGTYLIDICW